MVVLDQLLRRTTNHVYFGFFISRRVLLHGALARVVEAAGEQVEVVVEGTLGRYLMFR
jgi:hypothetical protein